MNDHVHIPSVRHIPPGQHDGPTRAAQADQLARAAAAAAYAVGRDDILRTYAPAAQIVHVVTDLGPSGPGIPSPDVEYPAPFLLWTPPPGGSRATRDAAGLFSCAWSS